MNDGNEQPMATYRLQFNQDFRFTNAREKVLYFSRLGVTHLYASPILRARQASTHGYDVVDPKTINPHLGDKTDLVDLVTDLGNFGLGLILDIVPNHTAASIENPYWRDVLTYGHSSPFAGWFDIDWRMPDPDMWGRVLVPVLGAPRSQVLAQDQIELVWSEGRFLLQYFDHIFPVDPATVPTVCEFGLDDLRTHLGQEPSSLDKFLEIFDRLKKLPKLANRLRRHEDIDRDEVENWLAQFARLVVQSPKIEQWAKDTARRFGQGEDGRQRLKKLLDSQPYRLVHWRAAARTINYRRFFDINELISIRQEDPRVFDETHSTVLRLVHDGLVNGLRIDHIDGLRDPLGYLERLAERLADEERTSRTVPIFVEKILAPDEKLPCGWPATGTTGYEFLNQLEAVFVSPEGFAQIENHYRRLLRRPVRFHQVAKWGKRRVLRNDLSPQVGRLADTLLRLTETRRSTSHATASAAHAVSAADLTAAEGQRFAATAGKVADGQGSSELAATALSQAEPTKRDFVVAIAETVAALPVYRTYVDSQHCTVSDADRGYIETALHEAKRGGRATPEALDLLGEVLLLENKADLPEHELHERVNFIQRFQQLTGPAAAKGIEDTALYAYVPLISLNEVGGEPHLPDDPVDHFHRHNEQRAATWPQTMLGVTTHDTKRTADVRARVDVLSELPTLWSGLVRRWQRLNRQYRARVQKRHCPDTATEYLFYQTLVGVWPAPDPDHPHQPPSPEVLAELRQRLEDYMLKAIREAKTHTSWTNNNPPYEDAVLSFVRHCLQLPDGNHSTPFLSDVQNLVARICRPGFWNSLSRTLIQFTAPGTPDLYQGDELWNFALVDPDNRRPVDYEKRKQLLDEVIMGMEAEEPSRREFVRQLVAAPEDGRVKLHVIRCALAARANHPALFAAGDYRPLAADGPARDHLVAFARTASPGNGAAEQAMIVIVPRLTASLVAASDAPVGEDIWSGTTVALPEPLQNRNWTCLLTRQPLSAGGTPSLDLSQALQSFPAALLVS
jgi:(1->4)-alpha-D-glucan 1-alpha-D-glucosylmutase